MSTSAKIWRQIKLIRYWCFFSWEIERFCVSSSLILKTEGGQGHRLQNCLPYSLSLLSRRQSIWLVCLHMTSWRPYLCPKTMKRRPCLCPKPVLWELNSFLMQTLPFVPINLHRCWPREWKHSIPRKMTSWTARYGEKHETWLWEPVKPVRKRKAAKK